MSEIPEEAVMKARDWLIRDNRMTAVGSTKSRVRVLQSKTIARSLLILDVADPAAKNRILDLRRDRLDSTRQMLNGCMCAAAREGAV